MFLDFNYMTYDSMYFTWSLRDKIKLSILRVGRTFVYRGFHSFGETNYGIQSVVLFSVALLFHISTKKIESILKFTLYSLNLDSIGIKANN
jgi:hypothetical protein